MPLDTLVNLEKVKAIFTDASAMALAEERAVYLDSACGGDTPLRQQVESLLAAQLKVRQIMLLPFAHLFAEPAPPADALALIDGAAAELRSDGFVVERPPFGWFHSWDMQAKGHPLSRVARTVRPSSRADTAASSGDRGA